jgi:hypothetical protein
MNNRSKKQSGGFIVPILKFYGFFISITGFLQILYYINIYGIKKISDWILFSDRKVAFATRLILINLIAIYFSYLYYNGNTNALQYLKELAAIVKESMKNVELNSSVLTHIQSTVGKVIEKIGPTFKNIINNYLLEILSITGMTTSEFILGNIGKNIRIEMKMNKKDDIIKKHLLDNNGYFKISYPNWFSTFRNFYRIEDTVSYMLDFLYYDITGKFIPIDILNKQIDKFNDNIKVSSINIATEEQKIKNEFYKITVELNEERDIYTYFIYNCKAVHDKTKYKINFKSKCDKMGKIGTSENIEYVRYNLRNIILNRINKFVYVYMDNKSINL